MGLIFISYRREDSQETAQFIYRKLCERFAKDRVFLDVETIPLGVKFEGSYQRAY